MNSEDLENIFSGLKNLIFRNEEIEEEAKEKLRFCAKCPVRTENRCDREKESIAVRDFRYKKEDRFKGNKYPGCGCDLRLKLRSKSKCPLGKF